MCGILFVKSRQPIALERHLAALDHLHRRGPDFVRYEHRGRMFVAQTVLRITGTDPYYHAAHDHFLAYNGEIYNYRDFGPWDCDIDLVAHMVRNQEWSDFKQAHGPWAWVYTHGENFAYASDPQGERCLYHYHDDDIVVVASDVATILNYVTLPLEASGYQNKCWSMISATPWLDIERCEPGRLYENGQATITLDSMFDWIQLDQSTSLAAAADEFDHVWQKVIGEMSYHPATLSYSGGVDSTMIHRSLPDLNLLAIDTQGKDPIVDRLLCPKIEIDPQTWAEHYKHLIRATKMPAQSWSHVGKWLVAMHAQDRVIFTGLAADELFGGYGIYQSIAYDLQASHSPYSHHDHDHLWSRCLDTYSGDARQATLLMDYWYQVVGVDAPGHDRLGGHWGRETRNPFMHQCMIKFALRLPADLKIAKEPKPVLREHYRRYISTHIDPKQGFAGHANDSVPWLEIEFEPTGDRYQDWKQIAQQTFSQYMADR